MTVPHRAGEDALRWLRQHREGTDLATALAFVDGLPGVAEAALTGLWSGAGWHTGHPWDGILETLGWWGKDVRDPDHVRPTLFAAAGRPPRAVSPTVAPVAAMNAWPGLFRRPAVGAAFRVARPLLPSGGWAARVRTVDHRGTPTAALVYDRVPIIDAFRRVTDDVLVGAADIRDQRAPLLFVLRRV